MPEHRSAAVRVGLWAVSLIYLVGCGVHIGIVAADTEFYRPFADLSWFPSVRDAWTNVFMANPSFWGLCVAAGELLIGLAVLVGAPWRRFGLLAAVAFHVGLLLCGLWAWSVPAIVVLVLLLRADVSEPLARV